jgi:twitching motility protein PilT
MAAIDEIFGLIQSQGASDLHIVTGAPPILRIHGEIRKLDYEELSPELTKRLLYDLMTEAQIQRFEKWKDIDFSYEIPGVTRLRCNVFQQRNGMAGVFRLIPTTIVPFAQIGLPQQVLDFSKSTHGLVLVTGSTGSGKSTTLASLIDNINCTVRRHVITIEDPIEFVHRNKLSLVNQREVGNHAKSFARALRAALREDPDILLVGEMRDLETIQLAITAAEVGTLVFATLHTTGAAQTVDRIIDVFPSERQHQIRVMLSDSIRGVVSQCLLKRADGAGRVPAAEVLVVTPAVSNMIREGKTYQIPSVIQTGKKDGMQSLDSAILDLLKRRVVTSEEAYAKAANKTHFKQYLASSGATSVAEEGPVRS